MIRSNDCQKDEASQLDKKNNSSTIARPAAIYAGFWRRLVAFIIDQIAFTIGASIVLVGVIGIMYIIFIPLHINEKKLWDIAYGSPYILYLPLLWLYRTIMESSRVQGTLGKMAMGIIVTDKTLRRIGFGRANGRFWGSLLTVETLGIGFLITAFTKKKQALHDFIAGTLVVRKVQD